MHFQPFLSVASLFLLTASTTVSAKANPYPMSRAKRDLTIENMPEAGKKCDKTTVSATWIQAALSQVAFIEESVTRKVDTGGHAKYPHLYGNSDGINFNSPCETDDGVRCQPYMIFPIIGQELTKDTPPGLLRVVYKVRKTGGYSSRTIVYCGVMAHQPPKEKFGKSPFKGCT